MRYIISLFVLTCALADPALAQLQDKPVPMDKALRRFRDLAGLLGQRTAARASEAWLMVAGCALRLK